MATWAQVEDFVAISNPLLVSNGAFIYFSNGGVVYQYTYNGVGAGAGTAVSLGDPTGAGGTVELRIFQNRLYALLQTLHSGVTVWRYVTGTTWEQVFTYSDSDYIAIIAWNCNTSTMMLVLSIDDLAAPGYLAYTSEGTSWLTGVWDDSQNYRFGAYSHSIFPLYGLPGPLVTSEDVELGLGQTLKLYQFNAGTLEFVDDQLTTIYYSHADSNFHWRGFPASNWEHSTDLINWTAPSVPTITPIPCAMPGMVNTFGIREHDCVIGFCHLSLHYWDVATGQWCTDGQSEDLDSIGSFDQSTFMDCITKLSNGQLFIYSAWSGKWYARSEPWDGSSGGDSEATAGGNRTWMYKSTDSGLTWVSRGVKTIP